MEEGNATMPVNEFDPKAEAQLAAASAAEAAKQAALNAAEAAKRATESAITISTLGVKIDQVIASQKEMSTTVQDIWQAMNNPQQGVYARLSTLENWKEAFPEKIEDKMKLCNAECKTRTIENGEHRVKVLEEVASGTKKFKWTVISSVVVAITGLLVRVLLF